MGELYLIETKHPDKDARQRYGSLVGIDVQKEQLHDELTLLLAPERVSHWQRKHHGRGLLMLAAVSTRSPLIILSGEVGCGKTALATSIATPLAESLDKRIVCMETPSDIRGAGRVGEISSRITDAFVQARSKAAQTGLGLLVIDEADDLATTRAQTQAHHEDRAGLNVLIKQIDSLARDPSRIAVILITNRADALDPAVVRRATLHLRFDRPDAGARRAIFERMLDGTTHHASDIDALVEASSHTTVPFSFSDLAVRLPQTALRRAIRKDRPITPALLKEILSELSPSPAIEASIIR